VLPKDLFFPGKAWRSSRKYYKIASKITQYGKLLAFVSIERSSVQCIEFLFFISHQDTENQRIISEIFPQEQFSWIVDLFDVPVAELDANSLLPLLNV
jgi:hypothetical protein